MNTQETTNIRNFIQSSCQLADLADDCDIFETRLANSLFSIELMLFIEKEFSVKITTGDLDLANFSSVNAIEGFLERKRA